MVINPQPFCYIRPHIQQEWNSELKEKIAKLIMFIALHLCSKLADSLRDLLRGACGRFSPVISPGKLVHRIALPNSAGGF